MATPRPWVFQNQPRPVMIAIDNDLPSSPPEAKPRRAKPPKEMMPLDSLCSKCAVFYDKKGVRRNCFVCTRHRYCDCPRKARKTDCQICDPTLACVHGAHKRKCQRCRKGGKGMATSVKPRMVTESSSMEKVPAPRRRRGRPRKSSESQFPVPAPKRKARQQARQSKKIEETMDFRQTPGPDSPLSVLLETGPFDWQDLPATPLAPETGQTSILQCESLRSDPLSLVLDDYSPWAGTGL